MVVKTEINSQNHLQKKPIGYKKNSKELITERSGSNSIGKNKEKIDLSDRNKETDIINMIHNGSLVEKDQD